MGVKERQEREREAVSRAILDAARDLFVAEGYQNVSIRKIADRIEYSPAAIYSYFPSKDDIFFALAEEGFHLLFASHSPDESPGAEPQEPIDRVRAAFWHFYQFSRKHPEYFALMFVDRSVPRITNLRERFSFISSMKERADRADRGGGGRRAASQGQRSTHGVPDSQHRDDGRRGGSPVQSLRSRRGPRGARAGHARGGAGRPARRDSTQLPVEGMRRFARSFVRYCIDVPSFIRFPLPACSWRWRP